MSVQLEEATDRLREILLDGQFTPGKKLREVSVADSLGVSRTIARLAMSALEHEGLLTREKNRGSTLRAFTVSEIADAIEVRGELEAMAARLAAERGLDDRVRHCFDDTIVQAEELLLRGVKDEETRQQWVVMNRQFHQILVQAARNHAITIAMRQMISLPLVSPESLIFDLSNLERNFEQLSHSHRDHVAIVNAIESGQGHRAEALVREHAFRSAQNKRQNLSDPITMENARKLPGGKLIVVDEPRRKRKRKSQPKH